MFICLLGCNGDKLSGAPLGKEISYKAIHSSVVNNVVLRKVMSCLFMSYQKNLVMICQDVNIEKKTHSPQYYVMVLRNLILSIMDSIHSIHHVRLLARKYEYKCFIRKQI